MAFKAINGGGVKLSFKFNASRLWHSTFHVDDVDFSAAFMWLRFKVEQFHYLSLKFMYRFNGVFFVNPFSSEVAEPLRPTSA